MARAYNISNAQVNFCITSFSVANIVNFFFSFYFVEKIGIKYSISIALGLATIGNGINLLINDNYYAVIGGQFVAGLGFPIFFAAQGEVCNRWFNLKSRPIVVAITSIFSPLGNMFGFLLPTFFVDISGDATLQEIKNQTFNYICVLCIMFGSATIINLIFFKSRPNETIFKKPVSSTKSVSKDQIGDYHNIERDSKNIEQYSDINVPEAKPYKLADSCKMLKV